MQEQVIFEIFKKKWAREFSGGQNAPTLKAFCLDFCLLAMHLRAESFFVWIFLWKASHDNEGKRWIIGALGRGGNGEFKQEIRQRSRVSE